jgi:hypothetical protein
LLIDDLILRISEVVIWLILLVLNFNMIQIFII